MPDSWPKSALRSVFRGYLSKFPLRDGKAYAYERLHTRLAPPERYVVVRLKKGFRMQLDLADPEQLKVYFLGTTMTVVCSRQPGRRQRAEHLLVQIPGWRPTAGARRSCRYRVVN